MAILNIFRKKGETEKPKEAEKKFEVEKRKSKKKEETKPAGVPKKTPVKIPAIAWRILKSPHVTEKATDLTKKNRYVFKVFPKANKVEIGKAIENLYGVDVVSVKVINISPKKRRLGRISGWKSGYKKAIVRIKEGQKIEVLPR